MQRADLFPTVNATLAATRQHTGSSGGGSAVSGTGTVTGNVGTSSSGSVGNSRSYRSTVGFSR